MLLPMASVPLAVPMLSLWGRQHPNATAAADVSHQCLPGLSLPTCPLLPICLLVSTCSLAPTTLSVPSCPLAPICSAA